MAPTFHLNTLIHPSHVTVGAVGPSHRPSLRSVFDYLGDPYFTSGKDLHQIHRNSDNEHVFPPNFDIRETADAYYLEGEFPSVRDRDSIFIEHLGSRGLLIEAQSKKLDLSREWGNGTSWGKEDSAPSSIGPVESNGDGSVRTAPVDKPSEVPVAETVEVKKSKAGKGQEGSEQPAGLKVRDCLSERPVGCLQRSFTFPEPLDYKNLKARLKDGLLRVRVPKLVGASSADRFHIELDE
jgi:HSP20 family molecular chaperone IbpA